MYFGWVLKVLDKYLLVQKQFCQKTFRSFRSNSKLTRINIWHIKLYKTSNLSPNFFESKNKHLYTWDRTSSSHGQNKLTLSSFFLLTEYVDHTFVQPLKCSAIFDKWSCHGDHALCPLSSPFSLFSDEDKHKLSDLKDMFSLDWNMSMVLLTLEVSFQLSTQQFSSIT